MHDTVEHHALLDLPLIGHIQGESRERVARVFTDVGEPVTAAPGEMLLHQGSLGGDTGFVLLQGQVTVEREGAAPIVQSAPALLGEMIQFNPHAERVATVSAQGETRLLKFSWQRLYARAKQDLTEAEQHLLMDGIERCVWERFDRETLVDLPLFAGLPDQLRLRVLMLLQWVVERTALGDGDTLFTADEPCGSMGFVLLKGKIRLIKPNYPARLVEAPNVVGVMPRFDPDLRWTRTAIAQGDVDLLRFGWQEYMALLQRRLPAEEQRVLLGAIEENAPRHFVN